jgi:pilus assembly protein CpaC
VPPPNYGVEGELRELLSDTTGVRVRRVGGRLFIEGGVSSEAELERINHVAGLYAGQVESLVVLGGSAAASKINVRVDVYFVQYERSKLQRLGIGWPGSFGGAALRSNFAFDFLANAATSAAASVANHPLPSLDMAANRGYAKVLKHATVIAANGSQASFANGGSQNFQMTTGFAASIQKISYGTDVKVLPRFEPATREIEVQVDLDVSDLTPSIAETNLPGQSTSTLSTKASLKLGESLILSGIRTEAMRKNNRGIPWLSEIPVLGLLFGTSGDENSELEGAIFVVPSVVDGASERTTELVQRTFREFREFSGDLDDVDPATLSPNANATRTAQVKK